jgi:hypothetical protein
MPATQDELTEYLNNVRRCLTTDPADDQLGERFDDCVMATDAFWAECGDPDEDHCRTASEDSIGAPENEQQQ